MSPQFSSPPDRAFYHAQVWQVVQGIPAGKVATYGQVAARISPPPGIDLDEYRVMSPRWVGSAMSACPAGVPWQRVVNAQGKISLPGEGGNIQRQLLESEGVEFNDKGKIDLKRFGWSGEASEQLSLF